MEMVVLCGIPGSGKSTVARGKFRSYFRVNLDELRTRHRERLAILEAIKNSRNIVIDATNSTVKTRKRYLDLAKQFDIPVRAIFLDCPLELALERNAKRSGKEHVPEFVVKMYYRRMRPPSSDEGFACVEQLRAEEFMTGIGSVSND